jgi:opacity protein-like surface antigen
MKKIAISAALAALLVAGVSSPATFAAAKKIGTAKTGGEGTASHEMSESSETQKSEGSGVAKKVTMKKASTKTVVKKTTAKK